MNEKMIAVFEKARLTNPTDIELLVNFNFLKIFVDNPWKNNC